MRLFDKKTVANWGNFTLKGGVGNAKIRKILSSVVFGGQGVCLVLLKLIF